VVENGRIHNCKENAISWRTIEQWINEEK
jgi:hypothetical protein